MALSVNINTATHVNQYGFSGSSILVALKAGHVFLPFIPVHTEVHRDGAAKVCYQRTQQVYLFLRQHKPQKWRYLNLAAGFCTAHGSALAMCFCAWPWQPEDPRVGHGHLSRLTKGCRQPQRYPTVSIKTQKKLKKKRATIRSFIHCPPALAASTSSTEIFFLSNSTTSTVNLLIFSFGAGSLLDVFPADQEDRQGSAELCLLLDRQCLQKQIVPI